MKVQIQNRNDCYYLYEEGIPFPLKNYRINFINPFTFDDEDILNLIGEKAFNTSFQNGKYEYNLTKNHLKLITGERSTQNRNELEMYKN